MTQGLRLGSRIFAQIPLPLKGDMLLPETIESPKFVPISDLVLLVSSSGPNGIICIYIYIFHQISRNQKSYRNLGGCLGRVRSL